MRPRSTVVSSGLLLLLVGASAGAAQTRDPEVHAYRFVSETGNGAGLWLNPGAAGFNQPILLTGNVTFDRPQDDSWTTGQYYIGGQSGAIGFGYRHDEFSDPEGFSQGDAYTLALGVAQGNDGLGVSRTWRTVGPAEGSWDIGAVHRAPKFSIGLVWRDIGSPDVRGVKRRSRLVSAFSVRPSETPTTVSIQVDYQLDGSEFRAFRFGGRIGLLQAVSALALAEWDGDGDFEGFRIGVVLRQGRATLSGGAGLSSGGDASTANLGASILSPRP